MKIKQTKKVSPRKICYVYHIHIMKIKLGLEQIFNIILALEKSM